MLASISVLLIASLAPRLRWEQNWMFFVSILIQRVKILEKSILINSNLSPRSQPWFCAVYFHAVEVPELLLKRFCLKAVFAYLALINEQHGGHVDGVTSISIITRPTRQAIIRVFGFLQWNFQGSELENVWSTAAKNPNVLGCAGRVIMEMV